MNNRDVMNLLTVIAQYDPKMMPATDEAIAIKAGVWGKALRSTGYEEAVVVVHQHYKRDTTPISVAVIYQGAHGGKVPTGEHRFQVCNPMILTPSGDLSGRYEVWCRRCGPGASVYTDTIDEAAAIRDTHQYDPPPLTRRAGDTDDTDWSESNTRRG